MKPRFLIRQHRQIARLLSEVSADEGVSEALRLRLVEELSNHLAAELDVLYPALYRTGGLAVQPEVEQLLHARQLLVTLADGPGDPQALRRCLADLEALFCRHVDAQEKVLFPTCVERLDDSTFRQILEDVAVLSFRLAASSRMRALRLDRREHALS